MVFRPEQDVDRMSEAEKLAYINELEDQLCAVAGSADSMGLINLRRLFELSNQESRLLAALSDGLVHTRDALLSQVKAGHVEGPEPKIIDVHVSRIRHKLVGSAIEVHTLWGSGYYVADVKPLKRAMAGELVPSDTVAPVITGRPAGRHGKGHGEVRDAALAFLEAQAVDGVAQVTGASLARAAGSSAAGGTLIPQMAKAGHIEILRKPRRGGLWKLRLLKEDFA